jgi:hypothetical protein
MNNIIIKNDLYNLRNQTHQFDIKNIKKMKSKLEIIYALSKKYPDFFKVIENGIQYKQFLSGFFNCIILNRCKPAYIKIYNTKNNKIYYTNYNKLSGKYNINNLLPWNNNNLILCEDYLSDVNKNNFKIDKKIFIESIIILFPTFFKKFNELLFLLNSKLDNKISINDLYNYLLYCGDTLNKIKIINTTNILSKKKIYKFLNLFTYEQLKGFF